MGANCLPLSNVLRNTHKNVIYLLKEFFSEHLPQKRPRVNIQGVEFHNLPSSFTIQNILY